MLIFYCSHCLLFTLSHFIVTSKKNVFLNLFFLNITIKNFITIKMMMNENDKFSTGKNK